MNTRIALLSIVAAVASAVLLHQRAESADAAGATKAPTLEGTWRWNFVMPDGTTNRPKLRFEVENGRLSGLTSFRPGADVPVTDLVVNGDQVSFRVVRHRSDREVVTTYRGRWDDQVIQGTIESDWAGDRQTFSWEAMRAHHGVEGIWRWTNSFFGGRGAGRGRGFESRVELEQEGEQVTGKTISRFPPSVSITNGVITNGVIYFEIERMFFETRNLTKYLGTVNGDGIKGTMESEINGEEREIEWEATRVD